LWIRPIFVLDPSVQLGRIGILTNVKCLLTFRRYFCPKSVLLNLKKLSGTPKTQHTSDEGNYLAKNTDAGAVTDPHSKTLFGVFQYLRVSRDGVSIVTIGG
jgi:hypothetical protein